METVTQTAISDSRDQRRLCPILSRRKAKNPPNQYQRIFEKLENGICELAEKREKGITDGATALSKSREACKGSVGLGDGV